jgi:hypothetical protein
MTTILTDDQLMQRAPSIFATQPWQGVSDKYTFIPTSDIVTRLRAEGFGPVSARQCVTRIEGKGAFTKHVLRFRSMSESLMPMKLNDLLPEIVLTNSHDLTSSYQLAAGLFRLVCLNGMTIPDGQFSSMRMRHSGDIASNVIDCAYTIANDFPAIMDKVEGFKTLQLSGPQQEAYASAASSLRWEENAPIQAVDLLRPRRTDDLGSSLWLTYQRVQENLIKGGQRTDRTRRTYGQARTTRSIKSVGEDMRLNKALWSLTAHMETLATVPVAA